MPFLLFLLPLFLLFALLFLLLLFALMSLKGEATVGCLHLSDTEMEDVDEIVKCSLRCHSPRLLIYTLTRLFG